MTDEQKQCGSGSRKASTKLWGVTGKQEKKAPVVKSQGTEIIP